MTIGTHTCRAWSGRKGKGEGVPSTGRNVAAQTSAQPTFEGRRREREREREVCVCVCVVCEGERRIMGAMGATGRCEGEGGELATRA